MEGALSAAPPAMTPTMQRARRIICTTVLCSVIFSCVMGYLLVMPPVDGSPTPVESIAWLLGSLPGSCTVFLTSFVSNTTALNCGYAMSIAFAGLEIFAWVRRIQWLSVTLLLWLLANMGIILVVYLMMSWGGS